MLRLLITLLAAGCFSACGPASIDGEEAGYAGPSMPSAAEADTRDGAVAFAEHYVATYNYARSSGDLNGLVALEAVECRSCQVLRHDLAATWDNGGRLVGGLWDMTKPSARRTGDSWVVSSPLRVDARATKITLEISRTTGSWEVLACDKEV